MVTGRSKFRGLGSRSWTRQQREAREIIDEVAGLDAQSIDACPGGCPVTLAGVLRSIARRPSGAVPALEAELYDGTAVLDVVWLGRREIPGIEAGRHIVLHGRVTGVPGRRRMFNPRYTLL